MKSHALVIAVVGAAVLWIFGPAVFAPNSFVYRDAAHYYYPQFAYTAGQWGEGCVPLWNARENLGQPHLADTTSGVLYPGKLIFALPLSFPWCYKLFILSHVVLAAATAFLLARRWKTSVSGAALCAMAYALGGNVMFQYCNVVFLIGAAWLPLALLAADRMLRGRRSRDAAALGVVLALVTLGGDPQTAYHVGLMAGLYALMLWRAERRVGTRRWVPWPRLRGHASRRGATAGLSSRAESPAALPPRTAGQASSGTRVDHTSPKRKRGHSVRIPRLRFGLVWGGIKPSFVLGRVVRNRFVLLMTAAAIGGVLAAAQILPAIEWTDASRRAHFVRPRCIYEVPSFLARADDRDDRWSQVADGLCGTPAAGTHQLHTYYFSVGPWRLAELFWPNVGGRQFPENRRLSRVIPAEGRLWTPSLYMGLLPIVMALGSLRLRRGPVRNRWLTYVALLAVLGSLGWFAPGWLLDEIRRASGAQSQLSHGGGPTGGVYWLMNVALPGYVYFRYPAKLLVPAALAACVLAGWGWDAAWQGRADRLRRALAVLAALSCALAIAALAVRPWWGGWMSHARGNPLFGPLDADGAATDLLCALLHTAVVCLIGWALLRPGRCRDVRAAVALVVTGVDLTVAGAWMAPVAPQSIWQAPSRTATAVAADRERRGASDGPRRVFRAQAYRWVPAAWADARSASRQRDIVRWDHDTLTPKYHLLPTGGEPVAVAESPGTLRHHDYHVFLRVARRHGMRRPDGVLEPHRAVLDAVGVRYLIGPDDLVVPQTEPVDLPGDSQRPPPTNAALSFNPHAFPRAWVVYRVERMPALRTRDPQHIEQRTEAVLFPDGRPRDLRREAVVETDAPLSPAPVDATAEPSVPACRIARHESHRVEVDVSQSRPGLLVLSDLYHPGWIAEVTTTDQPAPRREPILRTNRVMRGVWLPAGRHRVVFRYRPTRFYVGAALSAAAWSLLAAAVLVFQRRGATGCLSAGVGRPTARTQPSTG